MEVISPCRNQYGPGDSQSEQVNARPLAFPPDAWLFCLGRAYCFAWDGHTVLPVAEHDVLHAVAANASRA